MLDPDKSTQLVASVFDLAWPRPAASGVLVATLKGATVLAMPDLVTAASLTMQCGVELEWV